jgi:integrase
MEVLMGHRNDSAVRKVRRGGRIRWVIDFLWDDRDGRQHRYRRDARVQTREAATLEARELRDRALRHGTLETRAAAPTLKEFVNGSFALQIMPRFRKATRVRYTALLGQGLMEHFGALHLDEIRPQHVHAFAAELAKRKVQSKGAVMLLKTILRSAVDLGVLAQAPSVPRVWSEAKKLPDAPTADEIARLLGGARGWIGIAIGLAAYGGLRSGEVRALEVQDVDLAGGRLLIRRAFSEDELDTPKSCHERVVPIADVLRPILEQAVRSKLPRARLVLNGRGKTPTRQHILNRLNALEDRLGMRRWSFHAVRHFFCSTLLSLGASVEAVRVLAGHSGLAITQRYVHASGAELATAVGRFGGSTGNQ